jgi:hypothetical protein
MVVGDGEGASVTISGKPAMHPAVAAVAIQMRRRAIAFGFIMLRIGSGKI